MNCNDFWKTYNEKGLTPELREHLENCASCENEFLIERELDRVIEILPDHEAPDSAWERIAAAIDASPDPVPAGPTVSERIRRFARKALPINVLFKPSYAAAAIAIVAISIVAFHAVHEMYAPDSEHARRVAAKDLEKAEQTYLDAIEKFSGVVEERRQTMDPELYDLYTEKLAILDEYIEECREAVGENEYNSNARMYLALAYREKAETLKEMMEAL